MGSHTHFLRRHTDAELQKHQPSLVFPLTVPMAPLHKSHGTLKNELLLVMLLTVSLTLSLASALALPPTLKILRDFFPGNRSRAASWGCPLLLSM